MARVIYGAIPEFQGSIGGITFQRNASGTIARMKPNITVNPSALQAIPNANLSGLVSKYPLLTIAEKATWTALAIAHPSKFDDWGTEKFLSGYQYFLSVNMNMISVAGAYQAEAPVWVSVPLSHWFTLFAGPDDFYIDLQGPNENKDYYYVVFISMPARQGSLKLRRAMYSLGSMTVADSQYIDIKTAYIALLGIEWYDLLLYSNVTVNVHVKLVHKGSGYGGSFKSGSIKFPVA